MYMERSYLHKKEKFISLGQWALSINMYIPVPHSYIYLKLRLYNYVDFIQQNELLKYLCAQYHVHDHDHAINLLENMIRRTCYFIKMMIGSFKKKEFLQ